MTHDVSRQAMTPHEIGMRCAKLAAEPQKKRTWNECLRRGCESYFTARLHAMLSDPAMVEVVARSIENAQRAQGEAMPVSNKQWQEIIDRDKTQCSGTSTYACRMAQANAAIKAIRESVG